MEEVSVINVITVPAGMQEIAESVRADYVNYFKRQEGFVRSTFYRSINAADDGSVKYINTVVWQSYAHFQKVVNEGFTNTDGMNRDGLKVLGKGFPEPIQVSPGRFVTIQCDEA